MTVNISPLVSIIIPTYNRQAFIVETLNSVVSQTYIHWECIVVDDGSTDGTVKIIQEYSKRDKRFILIQREREPKGAPTCRNIGLDIAQGKYIIFLDSDDVLLSTCLARRVAFMESNPQMDFGVFSGLLFTHKPYDSDTLISSCRDYNVIPYFLNVDLPWITLNPMFRRESLIVRDIRWYEGLAGFQDTQFHLLCLTKSLIFKYSDAEPDCFWRFYDGDKIGNKLDRLEYLESVLEFTLVIYNYLKHSSLLTNEHIKQFNNIYYQKGIQIVNENASINRLYDFLAKSGLKSKLAVYIEKIFFNCIRSKNRFVRSFFFRLYHQFYWKYTVINNKRICFIQRN